MFHLRTLFQQCSLLFIHQKSRVPASVALNRLDHLGTHLHISHPKDYGNQKHGQHNAEPGHSVLFSVLLC